MMSRLLGALGIKALLWIVGGLAVASVIAAGVWLFHDWQERGVELALKQAELDRVVQDALDAERAAAQRERHLQATMIFSRLTNERRRAAIARESELLGELAALEGRGHETGCTIDPAIDFALDRLLLD